MTRHGAQIALVWMALAAAIAFAGTSSGPAPDILVKETTNKVLGELAANRDAYEADVGQLYQMVDEVVLTHFDFTRMSKLVLGKHWKKASEAQREKFESEFKSLLIRSYATVLFEYSGQEILYKPFHHKDGEKRALVQTEIVPSDGPNIPLHYALRKGPEDEWRVFDVRIDGISMVTNYRSAYSKIIESKGLDALIASLGEKRQAVGQ